MFSHAYAVRALTNSEGLFASAALSFQDNAFEYLDTLTVTLFDFTVNFNGITNAELRCFCFNCASSIFLIMSFISLSPFFTLDVLNAFLQQRTISLLTTRYIIL